MKQRLLRVFVALVVVFSNQSNSVSLASNLDQTSPHKIYLPFVTNETGGTPGDMALIPAGNFQMGCDPVHDGGYACISDEQPLHTVYLDAYRIDKNLVTNAQYAQCAAAGTCTAPSSNSSYARTSRITATQPTPPTR